MSTQLPQSRTGGLPQTSQEFDPTYFEQNPTSYSTRVYRGLASNPALTSLGGKSLGTREKLIIAATVMSAADEKILELERANRAIERVKSVINAPLFARAVEPSPTPEEQPGPPPATIKDAETSWIQSYLTLRNLLAVIVVVCGAIAGVMAWTTSSFKDRAEGAEKREETARTDTAYWKTQRDNYFGQVGNITGERDRAIKEFAEYRQSIESQQKAQKPLQAQLDELQKTSKATEAQLAEAQKTISTRDKTIATLQQNAAK